MSDLILFWAPFGWRTSERLNRDAMFGYFDAYRAGFRRLCPPGFIPVCSLGLSQVGRMNLGKDASTFKFYTMCGLQEGFEPFAVNMNREVTMWFSKRLPTFCNVPKDHHHITVIIPRMLNEPL